MRERQLPMGKTRTVRYANCTETYHVVDYNEKNGHNLWELKSRRWEYNQTDCSKATICFEDSLQAHRQMAAMRQRALDK